MKFTKLIMLLLVVTLFLNMQCEDDDSTSLPQSDCVSFALIDGFSYENAATSPHVINNVTLNEDCLIVSATATACDGSTWTMQLMDSGEIEESNPPERFVKFFLINDESCLAEISRTTSFDLSTLQIEGENEIIINIDNYPDPITYSY
ncbi:hypothetical protein BWZ20_05630 [Winogradskyella sp. J14-2]|uniref:hypothetical protein n=1 Tax=Winogradskyella sp. J14-2 TaxID=1936080 RepID=UPI000972E332|nr:hypothetical protein [Winogradskyella sp. J14-2]APY07806.1 hypothetical protein BWZ20_05630 [Winogradskyella sp. J14-2]